MRNRRKQSGVKIGVSRRQLLKISALGLVAGFAEAGSPSEDDSQLAGSCLIDVPGTGLAYYFVPFDKHGGELPWADRTHSTQIVLRELSDRPITDVFIFSHGWLGDITEAKDEYSK